MRKKMKKKHNEKDGIQVKNKGKFLYRVRKEGNTQTKVKTVYRPRKN